MPRFVVVGGGVAGMRAAARLKERVPEAEVIVLSEERLPFYRRPQLGDVAQGQLPETAIYPHSAADYRARGLEVRLGARVSSLDPEQRAVRTEEGALLEGDGIVIASGRKARPGVHGDGLPGVVSFTTVEEARQLAGLKAGSEVVVYGDTLPATEMVRAAAGRGLKVTYLLSGDCIWPELLDADAHEIAANRMRAAGVKLVLGAVPAAVVETGGRAAGVRLAGGQTYGAQLVGLCSGFAPALDFLPQAGSGLRAAADLSTALPGVVVAGDVAGGLGFNWLRSWRQGEQAADTLLGRSVPAGLDMSAPAGVAQADAAGARAMELGAAAGQVHVLNCQIMGVSLVAIGQTIAPYRSGYTEIRSEPFGDFYKKIVFDPEGRLAGALLLGNVAEAGALEAAVRKGTLRKDLDKALLEQLFEPTYTPRFMGVQCPVCRHEIQLEPGAKAGDRITCPICGVEFRLAEGPQGLVAEAIA